MSNNSNSNSFNQGVADGLKGEYHPPHSSVIDTINETISSELYDHNHQSRQDYKSGREVGKDAAKNMDKK
jgi:hypothetical protein